MTSHGMEYSFGQFGSAVLPVSPSNFLCPSTTTENISKEAWLDHKQECRCLKSVEPNFPPDSVRLAGRIVFKLVICLSERLYSFSDLQSNTEQLSEEMKDGLRHLAQTLQLYLKMEIQDASHLPPVIDFFQIFTKVSVKM
uniref:Uncharacterized protein n=1 Tax=Buteo japonicus TaxID=224669 RepID=A0A8C0HP68_9AVES